LFDRTTRGTTAVITPPHKHTTTSTSPHVVFFVPALFARLHNQRTLFDAERPIAPTLVPLFMYVLSCHVMLQVAHKKSKLPRSSSFSNLNYFKIGILFFSAKRRVKMIYILMVVTAVGLASLGGAEAASVNDAGADVKYGLVNAQSNVGTMNSPSKRAAQGLGTTGNWGIAIDGDSIPIDTKIKVVKHHETCAAVEESTFNIGNNEAMVTGTVDGATTAYFQGMMASQAGAYKICVTGGTGWTDLPKQVGVARVRGNVEMPDATNFQKTVELKTKFISNGDVDCCLSTTNLRTATSEEIEACENRHGNKPAAQTASNNNDVTIKVENVTSGTKVYFACTQPDTKAIANGAYSVTDGGLRNTGVAGATNEYQYIPGFYRGYQCKFWGVISLFH
jgi:hypothetical protein